MRVVAGADEPPARSAKRCPTLVFGTGDEKWQAIVEEVARACTQQAGPVLIGTRSIDKSEHPLAGCSTAEGIEHQVLNAHEHRRRSRDRRRGRRSAAK